MDADDDRPLGPGLDELDEAKARCDRGGFEGGVNFFDYYEAVRDRDLDEPSSEGLIYSEAQIP